MKTEQTHKRGWRSAIPFAMLFQEYISLGFVLYLSSGGVLVVAVLVRFCRVPRRLPFRKFTLTFLAFVVGEDIRQQDSGDVLDLMLRDSAVVGEFFPPAQVAPPKKYLPQLSPVRRRNGVLSVFCRLCFLSLRILPFLSKIENAAACQTFRPVCVCMMSCI